MILYSYLPIKDETNLTCSDSKTITKRMTLKNQSVFENFCINLSMGRLYKTVTGIKRGFEKNSSEVVLTGEV